MKRVIAVGVWLMVAGWVAAAEVERVPWVGETAVQNLGAAGDFRPGGLKLALTVHERSGVARTGAVVTSGVPFPPGFLTDVGKLRVVDGNGKAVVSQGAVMNRWWKPAYDDSVQWALVSFAADVPAEGKAVYYLMDDGGERAASPLKVTKGEKEMTIETGAATFVVPMNGEALLSHARVGGAEVLGAEGFRGVVTAGAWEERGLKAGDPLATNHEAAGLVVEESGPARVVVCVKGGFGKGDKDKKFYTYTARLYFAAGDPSVRVVFSVNNTIADPTLHEGKRFAYVWPMQDVSLVAGLGVGEKATATLGGDKPVMAEVGAAPLTLFQSKLDGYEVMMGGKKMGEGSQSSGWADVMGDKGGVTVARRFFASEWPGTISASAKELRLGLLPAEAKATYHLDLGQRKSWDVRLGFHDGKTGLQDLAAEQETLLLFRPDVAWIVRAAGVTGSWTAGLQAAAVPTTQPTSQPAGKPRALALRRKSGELEKRGSGWGQFGMTRQWNAGGGHWNEDSAFWRWVMEGDGAQMDSNEIGTLWAADFCPIQIENPDLGAFQMYLYTGTYSFARLNVEKYPDFADQPAPGPGRPFFPDSGHMGMWMWHEYYLLTGDERVRDAVIHLGDMGRSYLWRYTHEQRKDGTGPSMTDGTTHKHDPDAEADFMLQRRYQSWPLYTLMQSYQLTGRPEILEEGRIAALGFRNTARQSPIGQVVINASSKTGEDAHDKQTNSTEYASAIFQGVNGTVSQLRDCRKSASLVLSNFYNAYVLNAMREYYTWSRDVEALDFMAGQEDHFCKHIMIRNPEGKMAGWSYMFADYWGPYTWEDAQPGPDIKGPKHGPAFNPFVADAVASAFYPVSKKEAVEMAETANAVPGIRGVGNDARLNCMWMMLAHPKADLSAPGAVKDLAAEALGGGKVKLTWTAPGGDGEKGRATWYQVKWAPGMIVEITKGWPDRTEPLPATHAEWLERANAFNAKQRAFWAAKNVVGEPRPGEAGAKESMVVEGVAGGKVHFAVKAWDGAGNAGEVSNVVEVEVK